MPLRSVVSFLALVCALGAPLIAHDFWLSSATWSPPAGATWTVTATVGEHFPKGETGPTADRVEQWRVIGASGDVPVTRQFRVDKTMLSAEAPLPAAGAYLGVMTILARTIEMKGSEFTEYLKEEGLDAVIAARQASGDADKPAKERYARYAKIVARSGAGSADHLTRAIGLKAEFVPSTDPTAVRPSQPLTLQLVVEGKPVANAAVTALADTPGAALNARTDSNGRVRLVLDRPGAWLIKTVHMARLPAGASEDWESFWVTLALHTAAS